MMKMEEYFKKYNEKFQTEFNDNKDKLSTLLTRFKEKKASTEEYSNSDNFFETYGQYLKTLLEFEEKYTDEYFTSTTLEQLKKENLELYRHQLPENYESSYLNPSYCEKQLGKDIAPLMAGFFNLSQSTIMNVFTHERWRLNKTIKRFIEFHESFKEKYNDSEALKDFFEKEYQDEDFLTLSYSGRFKKQYDINYPFYKDIIENSDFTDPRYLFKFGVYITDYEIKTAKFLSTYPEDKLKKVAAAIITAYINGFKRQNVDHTKKEIVGIGFKVGLERLFKEIFAEFRKVNYSPQVSTVFSTKINRQMYFDHKFDWTMSINDKTLDSILNSFKNAFENTKDNLKKFGGPLYLTAFGEKPFSPENKEAIFKPTPEQNVLYQKFNMSYEMEFNKYAPRHECSFCLVALPSPEIGDKFEEIFDDTLKINMLDTLKYEKIQQKMIDLFDTAEYIHLKGVEGNKTDLKVKLQPISDPSKETLFVNSGANVNVPAGEIFTAPQLEGTNGVYYVEEAFIDGYKYENLELHFQDGYLADYNCTNFDNEKECKEYIENNLLYPHKPSTLPIGEFSIGTNTLAYAFSRKYDILDILPVLISEKTGPHLALGDTCFSRQEDQKSFNQFNNKEILAKDNSKSKVRKESPQDAYSNYHTDVVMDFKSIKFISAVIESGEKKDLIRDGKFVLEGTEFLNEALE
ncbi:MAG: aminopeptidase [Candidatus Hodarchaeota archaeon]